MIVLGEEKSIRQFKIYLEVIKSMFDFGCSKEEIYESMLALEKEIVFFCNQKRDISDRAFRHLRCLSKFHDGENFKGIEILLYFNKILPNGEYCSYLKHLFNDEQFDITRIDEMIKLFKTLVKYNIEYAEIGNPNAFDKQNYFLSTVVPENIDEVWNFIYKSRSCNIRPKEVSVPIFKTYSNQEISYTNINNIEKYRDEEMNSEYHYLASFNNIPEWVINGNIQVYRDKSIYDGCSSPHTYFNFRTASLYTNPDEFPSYEELYSIKQVKSLKI